MSITTRFPKIPEEQITPLMAELLELIQLQREEIQFLRDEIARLKGQKPLKSPFRIADTNFSDI